MENSGITRNQIVQQLLHIGHGDLKIYNNLGLQAVKQEPELFAHLIVWNAKKGEVRDSKVALPVIALRGDRDDELFENAVAHLCQLDPRNLLRACYYHRELPRVENGGSKLLKYGVDMYLSAREKNRKWWEKTALQHRASLKGLYALNHVKPNDYVQKILFDRQYPNGSVFQKVKELKNMKPDEAAGTILNYQIPFLTAVGALGGIKGKVDIVLALIERMSGNELINNTQMLQKSGVFENPMLKSAYDKAVERMKKDTKVSTLKAGRAAKAVKDEKTAAKLEGIQEQRLQKLGGIDGDWLVLGDRSGSMRTSIEVARHVASLIAQQVKGKVYLVFFNSEPTMFDVSGKTLPEIETMTKRVTAGGMTSIGCGLDLIISKGITVNGIAICSDGGDNTSPMFHLAYQKYVQKFGVEPNVYLYRVPGDNDALSQYCSRSGVTVQKFELGSMVDYFSLPNLIMTMRTNQYSLVDEMMEMPLLTFNDVFGKGGEG